MNPRWVSRTAWGLFAVICAANGVRVVYEFVVLGFEGSLIRLLGELLVDLVPIVFGFLGALILTNQPGNTIGWLFMIPATSFTVGSSAETYLASFGAGGPPATLPNLLMAWINGWGWIVLIFPILFVLLLFPTGKPPSPRWRWVIPFGLVWGGLFILMGTFPMTLGPFPNPIGYLGDEMVAVITLPWILGLVLLTLACFASLFNRYQRTNAVEREQIKWVFYSGGIFAVFYAANLPVTGGPGDLAVLVLFLALLAIPITITIAILRYRLWDIDIIIRRTVLYAALTALLGLVYFGIVVILQELFGQVSGQENSPLAIVISTLAIAALFNPLRVRLQAFIDRRFFRQKYNAEKLLEAFAQISRNEVEIERLSAELVKVVQETMQPASVQLAFRNMGKRNE